LLSTFEDKMVATFSNLGKGQNEQKNSSKTYFEPGTGCKKYQGKLFWT